MPAANSGRVNTDAPCTTQNIPSWPRKNRATRRVSGRGVGVSGTDSGASGRLTADPFDFSRSARSREASVSAPCARRIFGTFYFRLAVGPDSEKADLLDRGVSLVVHDHDGERWRSVVARGRLEAIDDDAVGTEAMAGLDRSHIPLFDVFGKPGAQVPFEFYRLVPDALTGLRESVARR